MGGGGGLRVLHYELTPASLQSHLRFLAGGLAWPSTQLPPPAEIASYGPVKGAMDVLKFIRSNELLVCKDGYN